jgi:hypothetical protein
MKNAKSKFLILLLFCSIAIVAQEKRPMKDRVDAMKIGFITDRLNLTPEEAKTFWPVYNQYSDELEKLRKGRRENIINARENFDEMSDAELEKTVDSEITFRQSELEIVKKYHPQFKKILPIKKVAKLYKAEEDFKRKLLDMLQDRRDGQRDGQRQGQGPPPQMH